MSTPELSRKRHRRTFTSSQSCRVPCALSWSTPPPSFAEDGKRRLGVAPTADEVQAARCSSPFARLPSQTADVVARLCVALGCAPSRRSKSRSAVVAVRTHQLAGPPSFRWLVVEEKWDQERAIWELGFCPSLPVGASSEAGTIGAVH
uniref:Uncharacterized protein n=1 Tax=Oryza sativa subsp. japonica TaxID=39947 RepID=Q652J8_ORYSJ|nr:hypothetical protein [Oryza sativa Japonica Group]BAD46269.1 hypothetical protein [Oryza sativa Japonica Group]